MSLSPITEPKQGMELAGRQLKINFPTGYRPSDPRASGTAPPPSVPLRAPPEILQQYRVPTLSSSSRLPERQSVLTERQRRAERAAERKQRELFVGNLAAGVVRLPSASPRRSPSPRPRSPSATRPRDALEIPALTFRPPATLRARCPAPGVVPGTPRRVPRRKCGALPPTAFLEPRV